MFLISCSQIIISGLSNLHGICGTLISCVGGILTSRIIVKPYLAELLRIGQDITGLNDVKVCGGIH